jgi:hypothetical protein
MTAKNLTFASIFLSLAITVLAQSKPEEVVRLEELVKDNQERALLAEESLKNCLAEANAAKKEAEARRYLAIAHRLADNSIDLHDKELALLHALHAYAFNTRYQGYNFDSKIYRAIYNSLKQYQRFPEIFTGHSGGFYSLTTNEKHKTLFSSGTDGRLMRWIEQNGTWKSEELFNVKNNRSFYCLDISADGNLIAIGLSGSGKAGKSRIEIYDLAKPDEAPKQIVTDASDIEKIIFSPDGNNLYALGNNGQSILHSDLNVMNEVVKSKEKIISIDLNSDGTKIVGGGAAGNLYVWNTNDYSFVLRKIYNEAIGLKCVAFPPINSRSVVVAAQNGELSFVSVENELRKINMQGFAMQIAHIKFSHSGKFMAACGEDNNIRIWNLDKINMTPILISEKARISSLTFSPDDSQMILSFALVPRNGNADVPAMRIWPLDLHKMAEDLCGLVTRNFNEDEWDFFVDDDAEIRSSPPCVNQR